MGREAFRRPLSMMRYAPPPRWATRRAFCYAAGAAAAPCLAAACAVAGRDSLSGDQTAVRPAGQAGGRATYLFHIGAGPELDQYTEVAKRFNDVSPTTQVEVTTAAGQAYLVKLEAMAAAGDPPEATFMASASLPSFADRGVISSLDPFVRRDRLDLQAFFASSVALCRWRVGGTEQLYGLPRHPSPAVLFYDRRQFEARGLKPPDASWTWDGYLDAARRLTLGETWGTLAPYFRFYLNTLIRSFGGDLLDKDRKRYTMDQPAAANAVQWVADLALKQRVAPPLADISGINDATSFAAGKAAQLLNIYPLVETVNRASKGALLFDIAPLPKGPKGRINRNVTGTYSLVKGAKNPDVGWEWLKFLTSRDTMSFLSTTIFPAHREAARSPAFLNPPPPAPQINRRVFVDALENDVQIGEPNVVKTDEINALIESALTPVWHGHTDARTALQSIAPQVNALLTPA